MAKQTPLPAEPRRPAGPEPGGERPEHLAQVRELCGLKLLRCHVVGDMASFGEPAQERALAHTTTTMQVDELGPTRVPCVGKDRLLDMPIDESATEGRGLLQADPVRMRLGDSHDGLVDVDKTEVLLIHGVLV